MALVLRAGFSLLRNPAHPREPHPAWNPSPAKPAHGAAALLRPSPAPGGCCCLLGCPPDPGAGTASHHVGSWCPRTLRIGWGKGPGQIQLLHAACAKIKLYLRVLFPPSMFVCDFPLLCLCGFVPLHPSGKAVPRILHGLLKVYDPHACTRLLKIHGGHSTSISPALESCPLLPQHMDSTKERQTPPPQSWASPQ